MRALLDVNVLLALLDQDHVHHSRARRWLEEHRDAGWASCAITQNGFLRIVSRPAYPNSITPSSAVTLLRAATQTAHHEFWPCGISLLDETLVAGRRINGHRQITDVYLLALAARTQGRLVTFDRSIRTDPVPEATADHLVVL